MQTSSARASLVILISGRGSNMRSLVEAAAAGELDCDIAGVISNRPDAAGLAWAAGRGIATKVVDHRQFAERSAFDEALGDAIDTFAVRAGADRLRTPTRSDGALESRAPAAPGPWVALAGFMRILGERFIDRYVGRIVNIHPSLLPLYPGLHTHRQALADGALLHGATVHLVSHQLDRGPILAQAVVPVLARDTESALAERVLAMEHRLYPLALQWLAVGRASVLAGRVLLDGQDLPDRRVLRHPLLEPATGAGGDDR
jgi:phosphoribosylglycinamide formyltransferase 1